MKLNVTAFALACGVCWGLGVFLLTWWVIAFDGVSHDVTPLARVYRGYSLSPVGSLIGLAWALPDGLIGGAVLAWLYNLLAGRGSSEKNP